MTVQERVGKLETLLARLNGRRAAGRPLPGTAATLGATSPEEDPVAPDRVTPVEAPVTAAQEAAVAASTSAPKAAATPGIGASAKTAVTPSPSSVEVEVEVDEGLAEVDLDDLEASDGPDGNRGQDHPVAAASLTSPLPNRVAELDAAPDEALESPASSERPIHLEPPLDALTFDDPDEGREVAETKQKSHPVPPESGRQIAVTPPSDFDGDLSGVRTVPDSPSVGSVTHNAPTSPPPSASDASESSGAAALTAEVTRAPLAAATPAAFHGASPAFSPATFGELLEATLSL